MNNDYNDYLKRFNQLYNYNPSKGLVTETTQLDLVKRIVDFLNNNYERGEKVEITTDGRFGTKKVIGVKSVDGDHKMIIATQISPLDLFYRIEDEFKNDIEKSEKRDIFLKNCIIDWFNDYEGLKSGTLSHNLVF